MQRASLVGLIMMLVLASFALLNWSVIVAPTSLSLGLTTVQAPLLLLMLGLLALTWTLFLLYVVYLHAAMLRDKRSIDKEIQALRKIADGVQASQLSAVREALLSRMEQLERELRLAIEQSGNSLAASLGEMDDRLRRQWPPAR